jgi:hypothetical protein
MVSSSELQISAYLGDLDHKRDLVKLLNTVSSARFLSLVTARSHAAYLRRFRPDLVPPSNPNGTPPSDHTVSTAFEHNYHIDNSFVFAYLDHVRLSHFVS